MPKYRSDDNSDDLLAGKWVVWINSEASYRAFDSFRKAELYARNIVRKRNGAQPGDVEITHGFSFVAYVHMDGRDRIWTDLADDAPISVLA